MSNDPGMKSPAQILFERIIRTWIVPEANNRKSPIALLMALVVWDRAGGGRRVFVNDEIYGRVVQVDIISAGNIDKGQMVGPSQIGGLKRVRLHKQLWNNPFVFICEGANTRYFVTFGRIGALRNASEFHRLQTALRTAGLELTSTSVAIPVAVDLTRNMYATAGKAKARVFLNEKRFLVTRVEDDATNRVRRQLRLPAYMVHPDDRILPLLVETRETYVDGHYFSSVAAAATTADSVCLWLLDRYGIDNATRRQVTDFTLGQKIEKIRALGLIDDTQAALLRKLNSLRKKHLHPGVAISVQQRKKDALAALKLLHEFLEGTVSLTRDYVIEEGTFRPAPLE